MFFFFFQAEDGIRDYKVTGVQTCALPISSARFVHMFAWMSGWVHQTPVSTTATRIERSPELTLQAVGAPIVWRPHWSTKNGSLGGPSSAWTGKVVTMATVGEAGGAAAPDTNE